VKEKERGILSVGRRSLPKASPQFITSIADKKLSTNMLKDGCQLHYKPKIREKEMGP